MKIRLSNPFVAMAPFTLFLFTYVLTSNNEYAYLTNERCLACGKSYPLIIFSAFTLLFTLGWLAASKLGETFAAKYTPEHPELYTRHAIYSMAIGIIAATICLILVLSSGKTIATAAATGEFGALREEAWGGNKIIGYLFFLPMYAAYIGFDGYYSYPQTDRRYNFLLKLLVLLCVTVSIIAFIRGKILELFILYMVARARTNKSTVTAKGLLRAALMTIAGIAIFGFTMYLRASSDDDPLHETLYFFYGYFITPYNKMVAIFNGDFELTSAPLFFYSLSALYSLPEPLLSWIKYINDAPVDFTRESVWRYQFLDAGNAGFNPIFIWATSIGAVYGEIGYWSIIYYILLGAWIGTVYRRFVEGRDWSRFFYPQIYLGVFWMFSDEMIFAPSFVPLFILASTSAIYLFIVKKGYRG